MLKTLHVTNLGIFGDVEADLPRGLVCLTGETGAGKSLLVDAIKLLLGARADPAEVRHGEKSALVEAVFDLSGRDGLLQALEEGGYEAEDGEVHLRRTITADGRSKAWIQGRLSTARELRELAVRMVSIAGQHAFMSLGVPKERLAMLDSYAGLTGDVSKYQDRFHDYRSARERLESLESGEAEKESRQDYLEFVIGQIEELAPEPDEDEKLASVAAVLKETDRLRELALAAGNDLFDGEPSAFDTVGQALKALHEAVGIDSELRDLAERMESVQIETREAARDLTAYVGRLESDPGRLAAVEDRLHALKGLIRKYGGSLEAVLRTQDSSQAELDAMAGESDDVEALRQEVGEREVEVRKMADALTDKRTKAVGDMSAAVTDALHKLDMEGARFYAELEPVEPGESGADRLVFRVRTNPGEGVGPVEEMASGGELSRIALSLFSVLSSAVGTPVMVFDEIDVGVSGGVADRMGDVLDRAANDRQVLVVTHHGQIAARANAHFLVDKRTEEGRTLAGLTPLHGSPRTEEIARMVGGRKITRKVLAHAKELLCPKGDLL
ncbi:MAG: DNA repair protein RecN [Deltaproteobacteria bacterium]|nr:DNA repair protein RecN [Deltaproteobacteria bacterium]